VNVSGQRTSRKITLLAACHVAVHEGGMLPSASERRAAQASRAGWLCGVRSSPTLRCQGTACGRRARRYCTCAFGALSAPSRPTRTPMGRSRTPSQNSGTCTLPDVLVRLAPWEKHLYELLVALTACASMSPNVDSSLAWNVLRFVLRGQDVPFSLVLVRRQVSR
jgi:hypothetical protein